eukprot:scaffold75320_cov32-Tisochrysis_lutea.AAC.1
MVLPCRAQQCCAQQVKARSLARFAGVKRSRAPYPCGLRSCVCMAWFGLSPDGWVGNGCPHAELALSDCNAERNEYQSS